MAFAAAIGLVVALATTQSPAPPAALLAQALDRCMATYAVRLTRTAVSDAAIYVEAERGCAALRARLSQAVRTQLPAAEAEPLLAKLSETDRPRFIALLARIRNDRARREAGQLSAAP